MLLIGSVICFRERMLFIDPAWIVYRIADTRTFSIAEHRYGAVATQIFPLAGVYFGWSMRAILILYSASFYIFYIAVILIAGRVYRQYAFGILMALYLLLLASDNFFWPNNEVHQGIGWMLLSGSFFLGRRGRSGATIPEYLLAAGCLFMAIFSHFIVIIPLVFLWIYLHLEHRRAIISRKNWLRFAAGSVVILVLFLIKYELGRNSWYDGGRLSAVKQISLSGIGASFTNGHAKMISVRFLTNYWLVLILLAAGITALLRAKKYLQAALTVVFVIGYFSLICMTYPESFRPELLYYIESEWMALAVIVAAPLVFGILPAIRSKQALAVVALICIIRIGYMAAAYPRFNRRFEVLRSMTGQLHQSGISKAVVKMDTHLRDIVFFMDWGTPVESAMLSDLEGYPVRTTFKVVEPEYSVPPQSERVFLNCFGKDSIRKVNTRYFPIDSSSAYRTLQWSDLRVSQGKWE